MRTSFTVTHECRASIGKRGTISYYSALIPARRIKSPHRCLDRVAAGRADFAIAAIRTDAKKFVTERFCSDGFHLVCRADRPLANAASIRVKDLTQWPLQLTRISVRQYLDVALHPRAMDTVMEVEQLATVMGIVRAGIGISIVPSFTQFHFTSKDLVIKPLALKALKRQLEIVRRRNNHLSLPSDALYRMVLKNKPV
jgi:DNA-binding transcriptional LysR family regulator